MRPTSFGTGSLQHGLIPTTLLFT